jgi:nucleoside-diphosphate-sugar epimerase
MQSYTVLGASGFIGSRIVKMLRSAGNSCYTPIHGENEIFGRELGRIFYCIGLTADYAQRPFATVEAHVAFLARVLENARFERLVYLSSTRLYDNMPSAMCHEEVDIPLNPMNPRHLYDLSKALGENLCLTASNGRASVARLSCVYDDAPGSPGFLSELLQRLRIERTFALDSSTGISRDYVALDDVVAILRKILDSGRNEIFNVASGENVSNEEIVETLNASGCRISLNRRSALQNQARCDVTKIRKFDIQPVRVRDYLKDFLEKLDANANR